MTFYNDEYTILSAVSLLIYILLSVYTLKNICSAVSLTKYLIYLIITILLTLCSVVIVVLIHRVSCMENSMMKNTVFYVNAYIDRAIEIGIIPADERELVSSILNPDRHTRN